GTRRPYCLPEGFSTPKDAVSTVEGETFLKLGFGCPFDTVIKPIPDNDMFEKIKSELADRKVNSIINMGFDFVGKNTLQIAESIVREVGRPVVFIHPKERKTYIWKLDGKIELLGNQKVPADADVWYEPADTRGTDIKIPPGEARYIVGSALTVDQFSQGVWRQRQLGFSQLSKPLVPESLSQRIKQSAGKKPQEEITHGDILTDIQTTTTAQEAQMNVKAELLKIRGIAFTGLRQFHYKIDKAANKEKDAWALEGAELENSPMMKRAAARNFIYNQMRPWFVQKKEAAAGEVRQIDVF